MHVDIRPHSKKTRKGSLQDEFSSYLFGEAIGGARGTLLFIHFCDV